MAGRAYRRNGTSADRSRDDAAPPVAAAYREFAPGAELRRHVRAFFSFGPPPAAAPRACGRPITLEVLFRAGDSFCSPLLADGHASLVVDLGATCHVERGWRPGGALGGHVIGAMSGVGATPVAERCAMVGAYFRPGCLPSLAHVAAAELTDRVVPIEDVWGASGREVAAELAALDEAARIDHLEAALLRRLHRRRESPPALEVGAVAELALREPARMTVERLADAAGVSRQHLARVFRERVGVTPKLYCRLARFHAALAYAGRGEGARVSWARAAAALGYADQSHMIAEFREFSSLTPDRLAAGPWFHPFIERARATLRAPVTRSR
jgi:AraC-like DNA-binding protein